MQSSRKKGRKAKKGKKTNEVLTLEVVTQSAISMRCGVYPSQTNAESRRERVSEWVRVECAALTQWSDGNNQVKLIFDITEKKILTSNDDADDDYGEGDADDDGEDDDGSFLTHEKP